MEGKKSYQEILWPVLLILLLGVCFVFTTHILWRFSRDECYYEIEHSASNAASTLRYNLHLYQSNLELVASLLTMDRLNDAETIQVRFESFCRHQQIDALCVQLQYGRLIFGGSTLPDYVVMPSFAEIAHRAPVSPADFRVWQGAERGSFTKRFPFGSTAKL